MTIKHFLIKLDNYNILDYQYMPLSQSISIIADYREEPSGIPQLLKDIGALVEVREMKKGDYLINKTVIIERKRSDDFVTSLIQNRLFTQCSYIRNSPYNPILLIEGDVYSSGHNISQNTIKGAIVSVAASWQIPVIFSSDNVDTASLIMMIARQSGNSNIACTRPGYKPKQIHKQQLYFLQGLPHVGAKTSKALLDHFGVPENIVTATEDELAQIAGVGHKKAADIRSFLSVKYAGK